MKTRNPTAGPSCRSAILGGSLEIVKKLQVRNIHLDFSANAAGMTPLHTLASNSRAVRMIDFLVRNGADLRTVTCSGGVSEEGSYHRAACPSYPHPR